MNNACQNSLLLGGLRRYDSKWHSEMSIKTKFKLLVFFAKK